MHSVAVASQVFGEPGEFSRCSSTAPCPVCTVGVLFAGPGALSCPSGSEPGASLLRLREREHSWPYGHRGELEPGHEHADSGYKLTRPGRVNPVS